MNTHTSVLNKMGNRVIWPMVLWMAAALMTAPAVRADIYTWTDAEGVIHFSNQDAPPQSDLYMKEPPPRPTDNVSQTNEQPVDQDTTLEALRRQAQTDAKLEEANRRLDRALEKVEELTDKVSQSQAQANAAAEAARQAAVDAEREAQAAAYNDRKVKERVVFYSSPYPYRYKQHGPKYRSPDHSSHIKNRHRLNDPNRHDKKHKFKRKRHYYEYESRPVTKIQRGIHPRKAY